MCNHLETHFHIISFQHTISFLQLKTDIRNECILAFPSSSDGSTDPDANEAASTAPTLTTIGNESILDNLLKGISDDTVADDSCAN